MYAVLCVWGETMEREILLFVQNHIRTEFLNGPVVFITKLGNAGIYWFCVLFILMCIPRTRKAGFTAFVSMGIVYVLDIMLLKNIVCRMPLMNSSPSSPRLQIIPFPQVIQPVRLR